MTIKEYLKKDLQDRADAINGLVKPEYAKFGKFFGAMSVFFLFLIGVLCVSVEGLASNFLQYSYITFPMVLIFVLVISLAMIMPRSATWAMRRKYFDNRIRKWIFTDKQITEAANLLVNIKPTKYQDLITKHSEAAVDILMITKSIDTVSNPELLQRIVSLKAIEKDMEAGEDE
jgi:hypothetical protein